MDKSADAYRTISEVADELKLPQHVLRFWETRFPQVRPMKRGGNRRFYRPEDVELLRAIRTLLYGDGYTIKGVQRILKQQGPRAVAGLALSAQHQPPASALDGDDAFDPGLDTIDEDVAEDPSMAVDEPAAPGPGSPKPRSQTPGPGLAASPGPAPRPAPAGYQSAHMAERLQAVLYDLSECERLLGAARG